MWIVGGEGGRDMEVRGLSGLAITMDARKKVIHFGKSAVLKSSVSSLFASPNSVRVIRV